MDKRIKEAFSSIHAEDGLKEKTIDKISECTSASRRRWKVYAVYACIFLVCTGVSIWQLWFHEMAVISVDINPSIELSVNRLGRIYLAEARNRDGEALLKELRLEKKKYTEAVTELLNCEGVSNRLNKKEMLEITVVGKNARQMNGILSELEQCTKNRENIFCCSAEKEKVHCAHEEGLSYGKYRAYLELKELVPDIEPEDVRGMTMREIREWIKSFSDGGQESLPENTEEDHHGSGCGGNQGNGHHRRHRTAGD